MIRGHESHLFWVVIIIYIFLIKSNVRKLIKQIIISTKFLFKGSNYAFPFIQMGQCGYFVGVKMGEADI